MCCHILFMVIRNRKPIHIRLLAIDLVGFGFAILWVLRHAKQRLEEYNKGNKYLH